MTPNEVRRNVFCERRASRLRDSREGFEDLEHILSHELANDEECERCTEAVSFESLRLRQ